MDNCQQGISVRTFSKTPCSNDTLYPQLSGLKYCVFDQYDRLVSYHDADKIEMENNYSKPLEIKNGLFTVVVWAGLDSEVFNTDKLNIGSTNKKDIHFRLRQSNSKTVSLENERVYFGESPAVFLPDPAEYGSVFKSASVNLQEITNRITVQVEGLPCNDAYEIVIESANGAMNMDGNIAAGDIIEYNPYQYTYTDILEARFTFLRLATGYNSTLIIRDKVGGKEVYRGDLLGTLLLKNPEVNLACDHDFTIRFTTGDQCQCGTYMALKIRVNNWLIYSYNVNL
jgi:hypothetical protein